VPSHDGPPPARHRPSGRFRAEQVALIPECAEYDARWLPADEDRWEAYLTDDEPAELVFYCEECAEREFGAL
jgi:hypothetical protein